MKNRLGIVWAPILIMVVAVVVAGVAAYYMFQASKPDTENTNVAMVNQANENINTNSSVNTNQVTNTNTVVNTNTTVNTNTASNTNATTDPYAGWKTYTDTEYTFTFRYPPDQSVVKETNNLTSDNGVAFVVRANDRSTDITIYPTGTNQPTPAPGATKTATTVGAVSAEKVQYQINNEDFCYYRLLSGPSNWAIGSQNNFAYVNFQLGCNETAVQQRILSTFKFTN
jgi:hypothetical protein